MNFVRPMRTQLRQNIFRLSRPCSVASRYASRFNLTMALLLAGLTAGEAVLANRVRLGGTRQLLDAWPGFVFLLGSLYYCERRPLPKLIDPCQLTIWAVLSSNVLALMIQLAARSCYPLADGRIAAMDHRMHFDTAAIVHLVAQMPVLQAMLALTYAAIPVLVFAAILIPPFYRDTLASRRYIFSVVVATIFTSILFALLPACGPWTTEGLHPTQEQAAITTRLLLLKSSAATVVDLRRSAIVSFPSFHVVLAVLSSVALNGIPRIKAIARVFALSTCIATITTGWHYGFDVLGGLAVAAAAWWIATLICVPEAIQQTSHAVLEPVPASGSLGDPPKLV